MPEDQTESAWLEEYGKEASGSGVFLKLEEGKDEFTIIFARDVTWTRSVAIAEEYGYSACKWIPRQIAAYATVKSARCAAEGDACVKTCRGFGCICHTGRRVCVSAASDGGSSQEMQPAELGSKEAVLA